MFGRIGVGPRLLRGPVALAALLAAASPTIAAATIVAPGAGFVVLAESANDDSAARFLGLVRLTLPPGAAAPLAGGLGPTLAYAESGGATATVDGAATVARAGAAATAIATPVAGGEFDLREGDALAFPAGASARLRNDGARTASVLVAVARPEDPFGAFPRRQWGEGRAELLVGRVASAQPGGPVRFVLARQAYDPGQGAPPAAFPGPALVYVETGRMTYAVDSGDGEITRGLGAEERLPERAAPGSQTVLDPGDAVAETAGTVSGGYAVGHARVTPLALLVEVADAGAAAG